MIDLNQVAQDVKDGGIVSQCTWHQVLEVALAAQRNPASHDWAVRANIEPASAGVPEGFALVPVAITEAMHVAAVQAIIRATGNDDCPPSVWAAMLAAAPVPPVATVQDDSKFVYALRNKALEWASSISKLKESQYWAELLSMVDAHMQARAAQSAPGAVAEPQPVAVPINVISLPTGGSLRRENRGNGSHGWLMYGASGNILRSIDKYEKVLIDAALAAAPTPPSVQRDYGGELSALIGGLQGVISDLPPSPERAQLIALKPSFERLVLELRGAVPSVPEPSSLLSDSGISDCGVQNLSIEREAK